MRVSELTIAVLGLGHVGLPTALGLADLGWSVIGTDDDVPKVEQIGRGEVPFFEPGLESLLKKHLRSGNFNVQSDVTAAIRDAAVLFICVSTPQGEDGAADLSQVEQVARVIARNLNGYKLIVEKSTTPVQTAQRIKQSILGYLDAEGGNEFSEVDKADFDVSVNPEFLREGKALHDLFHPDRIVLGVENDRAAKLLLDIYQPLLDRINETAATLVVMTDINTAEIIKHASNSFLATKISFANMLSDLCEATGANVRDVVDGMGMDPRIGRSYLNSGIGYGGSCFPKDLKAFIWIGEKYGVDFSILKSVQRVNWNRVDLLKSKILRILGEIDGKTLAVWGLAFKPETDDVREAPSLRIVRDLLDKGAYLRLYDPCAMDEFRREIALESMSIDYCNSAEDSAYAADAILILTEWNEFLEIDLSRIRDHMNVPLIVDGRNTLNPSEVRALGFEYVSFGGQ